MCENGKWLSPGLTKSGLIRLEKASGKGRRAGQGSWSLPVISLVISIFFSFLCQWIVVLSMSWLHFILRLSRSYCIDKSLWDKILSCAQYYPKSITLFLFLKAESLVSRNKIWQHSILYNNRVEWLVQRHCSDHEGKYLNEPCPTSDIFKQLYFLKLVACCSKKIKAEKMMTIYIKTHSVCS